MTTILKHTKGDKVIWLVIIILSIFSLLAVYSSTGMLAYQKRGGNTEYYLYKQFFILFFGFLLLFLTHLPKYTLYLGVARFGVFLAILLLASTVMWGVHLNSATRWREFMGGTFQPSDIAKLFLIMYLARVLHNKQEQIKNFRSGFIPVITPVIVVCALILRDNFSTAAILFVSSIVLMFIGRISMKYILALTALGLATVGLILVLATAAPDIFPRGDTWINRFKTFFHKEKASKDATYQVDQAKIAIVSGGLLGKSPGKSTQRNFLPHPYSDFIFAIIVEEYGIIGGAFIVLLYCILFLRIVLITARCKGKFGSFLAIGIGFSLVFQAMINMAVAVHLFPVTGQTLPLVSMGGTSIWLTCISLGIILSVSRHIELESTESNEGMEHESRPGLQTIPV